MTESAADALLRTQVDDETFAFLHALMSTKDMNVSAAAEACGLSEVTARRLLRKDNVRHVLGEMLRRRSERNEDVRQSVVLMLWRMACADPRACWRDGVQLKPWELPDELAAVLEEVQPIVNREGDTIAWRYRFAKRTQILEMLLRHFDGPRTNELATAAGAVQVVFRGVKDIGADNEG